ncbi:snurportin-1-like [Oppia nitens]|uniref:snurportin-1-like n=1 Tax=Oppia nitens TaxID=1686743 RepID=UPI0023DCB790|nr:snurportin-1-like [Oppia nitens]
MSFDELVESFSESFLVTKEPNDTNRCHPLYNQFKNNSKTKDSLQEDRRKEFFENQKKNRNQIVMKFRALLEEVEMELSDDKCHENMDTSSDNISKECRKRRYYVNKYKNQLMLSEWLVQIPQDFAIDWYLVLCPVGKRCLVISSRGQTKSYSRTGYVMATFPSLLPGGNRRTTRGSNQNCLLDCIFSETESVYYVLDVISWNGSHFGDCDTEFRFFWLNSRLESECSQVKQKSQLNNYPFVVLRHCGCNEQEIVSTLQAPKQFAAEVDGLLFYHKRCHYTPGVTPLVNWLKPHMLSDVLKININ